jgi:bacterioferritin-associated ferredoxin
VVICHCKAVSDRDVRQAQSAGACTPAKVVRATGAAKDCGGCLPALMALLRDVPESDNLVAVSS